MLLIRVRPGEIILLNSRHSMVFFLCVGRASESRFTLSRLITESGEGFDISIRDDEG
jgi:hypothetical protein